jgi:hypothetical protein
MRRGWSMRSHTAPASIGSWRPIIISMPCLPGLGPSGRLPEAYPGHASLPRPRYLQLMVPETMVELLAARLTKYHSSLVAGLLRCPGLDSNLTCRALPMIPCPGLARDSCAETRTGRTIGNPGRHFADCFCRCVAWWNGIECLETLKLRKLCRIPPAGDKICRILPNPQFCDAYPRLASVFSA